MESKMASKENPLHIYAIKTKNGYYITNNLERNSYRTSYLKQKYFDGKFPKETFNNNWLFIEQEPKIIEEIKSQPNINYRYELIDPSMQCEKIPLTLKKEVATYFDDDEYEDCWYEDYKHLSSLYQLKYDEQPNIKVPIDFKFEILLELDEVKEFNGFAYPVQKTQWASDGLTNFTEKDVKYQILDEILFPDLVLPSRPCELSSEQVYKIVRQYIKQNIDYTRAKISSDYDFCFQVEKLIQISDPYEQKTEIMKNNGKSYRPPKYNTKYIKNRTIKCFEMTYSPKNYNGYTPIPAMIGENIDDLKGKVDRYCKEIIDEINKPLIDCPHCKGNGVILEGIKED